MTDRKTLALLPSLTQLTAEQFRPFAVVPAETEWLANLGNKGTRRVYEPVIRDLMRFTGIATSQEFRTVTRAPMCSRGAMISTAGNSPLRLSATISRGMGGVGSCIMHASEE